MLDSVGILALIITDGMASRLTFNDSKSLNLAKKPIKQMTEDEFVEYLLLVFGGREITKEEYERKTKRRTRPLR